MIENFILLINMSWRISLYGHQPAPNERWLRSMTNLSIGGSADDMWRQKSPIWYLGRCFLLYNQSLVLIFNCDMHIYQARALYYTIMIIMHMEVKFCFLNDLTSLSYYENVAVPRLYMLIRLFNLYMYYMLKHYKFS